MKSRIRRMRNKVLLTLGVLGVILIAAGLYFLFRSGGPDIYVANEGDGTLSVIDSTSLKVVKIIKLSGMPHNVNSDPLGRYIYATNHEEDEHMHHIPYLRIIDASTRRVVKSVPMTEKAAHVVPARDGKVVYVSREGGNTIVEVDIDTAKIKRTFSVGAGPHGFVLSNDGKTLYVPNMKSNDISIVDVVTGDERRLNVTFGGYMCETPVAMGITADNNYSFVTCGHSFDIYKIENVRNQVIGRIALKKGEFPGPIQIPTHPDNKHLYVPDMRNGVVHKIDIEKFEIIKDILSGSGAHGIAYSADGKNAYITNTWENTVSVLDVENDILIKKIAVGSKPNGIAVMHGKNQGW